MLIFRVIATFRKKIITEVRIYENSTSVTIFSQFLPLGEFGDKMSEYVISGFEAVGPILTKLEKSPVFQKNEVHFNYVTSH